MLARSLRADVGVMISASHNSYEDNGIKLFGPDGNKLSDENEIEIESIIDNVINHCPEQVMQYRTGQEKGFGFLIGQVMQITGGKANPKIVNKVLRDKLSDKSRN